MWPFSINAIAVVGNGPVEHKLRRRINRHRFVVRFNSCKNFGDSGTKTDALVMVPTGPTGELNVAAVNRDSIEHARAFWFTKSRDLIEAEKSKPSAGEAGASIWDDWSEIIIERQVRGRPYLFFPAELYWEAKRRLTDLGATEPFEPSSGVLALLYLRKKFPGEGISLFGFTHEGWRGHAWEAERLLCAETMNMGRSISR